MTSEQLQRVYPYLTGWIASTLCSHAQWTCTVASAGFERLPLYFSAGLLERAKFITVAAVPVPPLAAMGLPQFLAFEQLEASGITYLDTYFVRLEVARQERLHFHELVHVVQWLTLGPERFLSAYADGLERHGYRNNPLEVMAYEAENDFARGHTPFDAEERIQVRLKYPF